MQRISKNNKKETWLRKPILSGQFGCWLMNAGSLTLRLQARYVDFKVTPLMIGYIKANQDEVALLHMSNREPVLIRNVFLMGCKMPVVFAHSVLPRKYLRGRWLGLRHLGSQPLGASLFSNPKVKRTALSFKKIGRNHPLYQSANKFLHDKTSILWARRSIFYYQHAKIIVTEVFLPTILTEINHVE